MGTLYNVFGNLDTLILHLNGKTLDGLYEVISPLELSDDPETAIRQITGQYHDYTVENALLWGIIFQHVWPPEYVLPDWYQEKIGRLLGVLARALRPLVPGSDDEEALQAAAVLWSGLHGLNSLAVTGKIGLISSESLSAMTTLMVRSFVGGLPLRKPVPTDQGQIVPTLPGSDPAWATGAYRPRCSENGGSKRHENSA